MTRQSTAATERQFAVRMVLVGILFVMVWRGWVLATQYFHESPAVRELCGIRQFEQDLSPNSANTRLVFCQDTDEGVGIYFCDTAGGKPRLLCEQKQKGGRGRRFTMLGWSPDDSVLACAWPEDKKDQQLILIFDGRTGERLKQVVADPTFNQFGWLSSESFAYSVGSSSVRVVTKQSNGDWIHKRFLEQVGTNMDNFTAVAADAVAWRENDGIKLLHLNSKLPVKIWEATTNLLTEFTYARASHEYLLNCTDAAGQYLLCFRPDDQRTIDLGRISSHQNYIHQAAWNGSGSSYACLTNDMAGSAFCLKNGDTAGSNIISWHGGVRSFTLNGNHLFFSGNPDNQAPGIWDYEIKSGVFKCIVTSTSSALKISLGSPSSSLVLTNSAGEQRYYHLWQPTHILPGKKYPVLLAQELNTWFPYFQIAAQSGCYVAVVDRPFFNTWNGEREHSWIEDVSRLREIMAQNPSIDTNRVYLYACSAETYYLSQLMNERPALANGAILFSPTELPNPAILDTKRLLIVDGMADGDAIKRLTEFQDRATEKGSDQSLFLQNDAGHIAASGTTETDRARQFAKFMSDSP